MENKECLYNLLALKGKIIRIKFDYLLCNIDKKRKKRHEC